MSTRLGMNQDKLIGTLLLLPLVAGIFYYMQKQPPPRAAQPAGTNAASMMVAATNAAGATAEAIPDTAQAQPQVSPFGTAAPVAPATPASAALALFALSNEVATYTFSSFGGDLASIVLAQSPTVRKGPIRISCAASNAWEVPLRIRNLGGFDLNSLMMAPSALAQNSISFTGALGNSVLVTKRFTLDQNYLLRTELTLQNIGTETLCISNQFGVWLGRIDHATDFRDVRNCSISLMNNSKHALVRKAPDKKDISTIVPGSVEWLAVCNKYFAQVLVPETNAIGVVVNSLGTPKDRQVSAFAAFEVPDIAAGASFTWRATLFAGPKAYDLLQALPKHVGRGTGYTDVVDLGWFTIFARPMLLYGLKGLYTLVHSYGIAIIILTIIIKILTWPLQTKSYVSMQRMQQLKPELEKLQAKLKGEPQRLQQEQWLLYRKHGVNPLGGCLPMFLQIPIFVALYNAVNNAVELWGTSFLWIKDLSMPDTIYTLPFAIPFLGDGINLLPILMTGATLGQQAMTPSTGDKQQQTMMYMMPVMFLFIFYSMPSGLVMYWFVNQLLSMGQTFYLHYYKKIGSPAAAQH